MNIIILSFSRFNEWYCAKAYQYHVQRISNNAQINFLLLLSLKNRLGAGHSWACDQIFSGWWQYQEKCFFQLLVILARFTQVIRGVELKIALPFAYALIDGKSEVEYPKWFKVVNDACTTFHVHRIVPLFVISVLPDSVQGSTNSLLYGKEDITVENAAKICTTVFVSL